MYNLLLLEVKKGSNGFSGQWNRKLVHVCFQTLPWKLHGNWLKVSIWCLLAQCHSLCWFWKYSRVFGDGGNVRPKMQSFRAKVYAWGFSGSLIEDIWSYLHDSKIRAPFKKCHSLISDLKNIRAHYFAWKPWNFGSAKNAAKMSHFHLPPDFFQKIVMNPRKWGENVGNFSVSKDFPIFDNGTCWMANVVHIRVESYI